MVEIALVNPPQLELREPKSYIPLGIGYLASSLIKHGIEDIRIDNLADKRENDLEYADIFGITYPSAAKESVGRIIEYVRRVFPESKIMLGGGAHPTVAPFDTYETMKPDVVVMGEAEEFLPTFIKDFKSGVFDARIIENLDSLPFPARHLFEKDAVVNKTGIHGSNKPSTTVITSRGCPYECYFCCKKHNMYRHYRYRSPRNVFLELNELKQNYGIGHVRFIDDCFTLIPQRAKKICYSLRLKKKRRLAAVIIVAVFLD